MTIGADLLARNAADAHEADAWHVHPDTVALRDAGDAGPDDDEVLGQLGQVPDLLPGQDALAVWLRRCQFAGTRSHGHHERVRDDLIEVGATLARSGGDDDASGSVEPAITEQDADAGVEELRFHVGRLLTRQ